MLLGEISRFFCGEVPHISAFEVVKLNVFKWQATVCNGIR